MEAKYNFDINLKNASYNKNLDIAKKEWKFICDENRKNKDGLCICQRKVKNVIYMYNIKTKNTICVGTTCHKKFNMATNKVNSNLLNILKKNIEMGEYSIINNIITYFNSINKELITYFENEYINCIKYYESNKIHWDDGYITQENRYIPDYLPKLLDKINTLINEYELEYLQDISYKISNKIKEINRERKEFEETKVFNLKIFYTKFSPYTGHNDYENQYFYTSLEKCNEHILKIPEVGKTKYTDNGFYKEETIYNKIEILHNNILLKIIQN